MQRVTESRWYVVSRIAFALVATGLLVVACGVLSGCASRDPAVGTWLATLQYSGGEWVGVGDAVVTLEIEENGKVTNTYTGLSSSTGEWRVVKDSDNLGDREYELTFTQGPMRGVTRSFEIIPVYENESSTTYYNKILFMDGVAFESNPRS